MIKANIFAKNISTSIKKKSINYKLNKSYTAIPANSSLIFRVYAHSVNLRSPIHNASLARLSDIHANKAFYAPKNRCLV
jgi:hypothetical protein